VPLSRGPDVARLTIASIALVVSLVAGPDELERGGRLQVAMDDAAGVGGGEGAVDRRGERKDLGERESAHQDDARERRPLDELHREKRNPFRLFDRVNRDNVGMVQRGDREGLALEPAAVLRIVASKYLEGDIPLQAGIVGAVDLAHSSAAEQGNNLIGAEGAAPELASRTGPMVSSGLRSWRP
jgi:hypothetical protein